MRGKTMKTLDVGRAGEDGWKGSRSEGQNKTMGRIRTVERKKVCVNWKRK